MIAHRLVSAGNRRRRFLLFATFGFWPPLFEALATDMTFSACVVAGLPAIHQLEHFVRRVSWARGLDYG